MQSYRNPHSKRKLKARAKYEEAQFTKNLLKASVKDGTDNEFCMVEARAKRIHVESGTTNHSKFYEPKRTATVKGAR